jgi:uncharacterized membrane protein YcaP (DUF421 family)
MVQEIQSALNALLGTDAQSHELSALQMGIRALVVYLVTLLVVRLAKKRFMGRATAFDVILGIMLGSLASRAITGTSPLVPTLVATAMLVFLHWIFSGVALRWHGFGVLIKGRPNLLVREGQADKQAMEKEHLTEHDLWEDLRTRGIANLAQVKEARLERSGQLSVIRSAGEPKVLDVKVANGVQTVRIELR